MNKSPVKKIVAITSIGSTGAINVVKMLRSQSSYDVRLIGLDGSGYNPGRYLTDAFYQVPMAHLPGYIDEVEAIIEKERVDLLIPVMEQEVEQVATRNEEVDLPVICPSLETVRKCHDKESMSRFLMEKEIDVPSFVPAEQDLAYPFLLKHKRGGGSKEVFKINSEEEKNRMIKGREKDFFCQQIIEGPEFSVDGFVSPSQGLIGAVPRIRSSVKNGLAVRSEIVDAPGLIAQVEDIVRLLDITGPFNIQAIEKEGIYYCFDVNLRFGGGAILSMKAGLNGPLMMLSDMMGDTVHYAGYRRLKMLRYWEEIFLDEEENMF